MRLQLTAEERFWSQVDPCRTDGCCLWLGAVTPGGYGQMWFDGRNRQTHYFLAGTPPEGMQWDHVKERGCTNRNCCWPDHLEAVTPRENRRRGAKDYHQSEKTHCPHGHAYDEANTRIYEYKGLTYRYCRACDNERSKAKHRRRMAALI